MEERGFPPFGADAIGRGRWERCLVWNITPKMRRVLQITVLCGLALVMIVGAVAVFRPTSFSSGNAGGGFKPQFSIRDLIAQRPLDSIMIPKVEPVDYLPVQPDEAKTLNAAIPFSTAPNIPARPFIFLGTPLEHERAITCLAAAQYYEAGNDPAGQAAVAQVVVNRLRHPAFPKSVCGVVLQGASRSTGCQFTFACDGSIASRPPSPAAWASARATAERALTGGVFVVVGQATHYHTDWVMPRWSPEMDKIIAFHGHLFFRWRGAWGQPSAMRGQYAGPELLDPRLLNLSNSRAVEEQMALQALSSVGSGAIVGGEFTSVRAQVKVPGVGSVDVSGAVKLSDDTRHIYYVHFDGNEFPGSYAVTAWKICAGKSPCSVYGWRTGADMPTVIAAGTPSNVSFAFRKGDGGQQSSLWNCRQLKRDNPAQCLPGTSPTPVPVAAAG